MIKHLQTAAALLLLLTSASVLSSELVYHPRNPTFGGNPAYTTHLLGIANAQNEHKDPDQTSLDDMTSIEEFNDRLQRSIISRITSSLSASIIGDDGTINPGIFETTDFVINVEDLGGDQVRITTTDKLTSDETIFEINTAL